MKRLILVGLIFFLCAASLLGQAQEKKLRVTGEAEVQINEDGEKYTFSQFVYEEYGRFSFVERWYPAQGRPPRYDLGAGLVLKRRKGIGPITDLVFKPVVGWTKEGSQYLMTKGTVNFRVFQHPVTLTVDRKNLVTGERRGTFQFQKVRISLWRGFWARWEGNFKEPFPGSKAKGLTWNYSHLGLEFQKPIGKRYKPFVTWQYDFTSHKWVSHFGLGF